MNEQDIITNPPPPMGIIPTEVPLGVSGRFDKTLAPVNIPADLSSGLDLKGNGLFLTSFTIDETMVPGTLLFDWTSRYPCGETNPFYYPSTDSSVRTIFPPVWEFVKPIFSQQTKMDFMFQFKPIKVSDCRASIDIVFNQEDVPITYGTFTLANESMHKILDDSDDPINFSVPMIWPINNVATKSMTLYDTSQTVYQPPYVPYTRMQVFLRNPYQPNLMQPSSFEILVFLYPIPHSTIGIASSSLVRTQYPTLNDHFPIPWFINKVT